MKIYFEVKIPIKPKEGYIEIIVARLSNMDFEGFVEEDDHILAYCEKEDKSTTDIEKILLDENIAISGIREIEDENWNANWESAYEAVLIKNRIMVRAPFHAPVDGFEYDIIIEPKMSFGTAHHETTALMLEHIRSLTLLHKKVLDMGSGTGVLAILAFKMGAGDILAIDNDEWAWQNALDNVKLNGADSIKVEMGDAGSINSRMFDIIFANINRNILLRDIPAYVDALQPGGKLLLSGFYEEDLPLIREKCISCGLEFNDASTENKWIATVFTKE